MVVSKNSVQRWGSLPQEITQTSEGDMALQSTTCSRTIIVPLSRWARGAAFWADSVAKVEKGTSLVNESGEALRMITESVKKVSDIVAAISESSQEQANGIGQINQAVSQIDETTQQNAALVEESAAASEAMSQKVKLLAGLAYQFKQENAN